MLTLTMNGRIVSATPGQSLLQVARAHGVAIPTLCYHAGLESHGGCRLCLVEVTRPEWDGWKKVVVSCEYPAEAGLIVSTDTPEVRANRKVVLELLIARCPEVEILRDLGREYGVEAGAYVPRAAADRCILCAICTRTCAAVGAHAIATMGRGVDKEVGLPAVDDASACIGCLACATNCPTGHIPFEETDRTRTIWGRTFELVRCRECGAVLGTPEQLAHYATKSGLPAAAFECCDVCRKRETARSFHALMGLVGGAR